jgi:N-acetylmuramoyl-L-alanine amidase
MHSFRAAVFGREEENIPQYATTANLNIRTGPGTQHQTLPGSPLPGSPLPKGTRVEILEWQGNWRLVDVVDTVNDVSDLQGWVHGHYLSPVI